MRGQDLERKIVQKWRKAIGKRKLEAQVRKSGNLNKLPEATQILRNKAAVALHQRNRVEHILAGKCGAVMPDGIIAQVNHVARPIGRDLPICRKIPHRQPAGIKFEQTAENQSVNIPVSLVITIQRRIQAHDLADQPLGKAAARDRVWSVFSQRG